LIAFQIPNRMMAMTAMIAKALMIERLIEWYLANGFLLHECEERFNKFFT